MLPATKTSILCSAGDPHARTPASPPPRAELPPSGPSCAPPRRLPSRMRRERSVPRAQRLGARAEQQGQAHSWTLGLLLALPQHGDDDACCWRARGVRARSLSSTYSSDGCGSDMCGSPGVVPFRPSPLACGDRPPITAGARQPMERRRCGREGKSRGQTATGLPPACLPGECTLAHAAVDSEIRCWAQRHRPPPMYPRAHSALLCWPYSSQRLQHCALLSSSGRVVTLPCAPHQLPPATATSRWYAPSLL